MRPRIELAFYARRVNGPSAVEGGAALEPVPVRVRGLVWRGIAWGASVALLLSFLLLATLGPGSDVSLASPGSHSWFRTRFGDLDLVAPIAALLGALLGALVGPFVADAANRTSTLRDERGRASVRGVAQSCGVVAAKVTGVVLLLVMVFFGVFESQPLAQIDWVPGAAGLAAVAGLLAAYEGPRASRRSGVPVDGPATRRWLLGAALAALALALVILRLTVLPST